MSRFLCHTSRQLGSHVTAEAELGPDLVCDVCKAPAANTKQDRQGCERCVCVCERYYEEVKDGATRNMNKRLEVAKRACHA